MNQDLFFDAMDYIDDDIIEAVDALRSRKKPIVSHTWIRWTSAAACVCIVAGGIWTASRYGWFDSFDSVEMEDAENQEAAGGPGYIHSFIRVTVDTNDQGVQTITDIRSVSTVYNTLQILMEDGDSLQYSEAEKAEEQVSSEGEDIKSENIGDSGNTNVTSQNIVITLVTADDEEKIYRLEGCVLTEQDSGKSVTLTEKQIKELHNILNVQ